MPRLLLSLLLLTTLSCIRDQRAAYYGWNEPFASDFWFPTDAAHPRIEERFHGAGAHYALSEPLLAEPFELEVDIVSPWGDEEVVLSLRTCRQTETFCEACWEPVGNTVELLDLDPTPEETVVIRYFSRLERL